jgi:hypothetical protein
VRLLDPVLDTTAARSVDDAAMVLTNVGSGMRGINAVPGGGPLGVLPVVTVPTVAAGVGAVVAICVIATPTGPLMVGVLTALISPFELAYSAVACVGVLARLSALGPVVVAASAGVAGLVVVGVVLVGVAGSVVVNVVPAVVAGLVVVGVVLVGVAGSVVVVVVPARAIRSIVVVPVGVVAVVPAHVALPIAIFRPTHAQEGQTQVGRWSAASRVHRVQITQ